MSEVKHTPSELHAVFNGLYWDVAVGPRDYDQCVGSCHPNAALGYGVDGAERYARLFAAAPDLLEAVRALKAAFGDPMTRRALGGHNERQMEAILSASAAINRATGDRPEKGGAL